MIAITTGGRGNLICEGIRNCDGSPPLSIENIKQEVRAEIARLQQVLTLLGVVLCRRCFRPSANHPRPRRRYLSPMMESIPSASKIISELVPSDSGGSLGSAGWERRCIGEPSLPHWRQHRNILRQAAFAATVGSVRTHGNYRRLIIGRSSTLKAGLDEAERTTPTSIGAPSPFVTMVPFRAGIQLTCGNTRTGHT
jgi:hypothetical protein